MPGGRPYPLIARILLLGVLLIALWNPAPPWRASPLDLVVLMDASASLSAAARAQAWRRLAVTVRGLPDGSRLSLLRFAALPVEEQNWKPTDDPTVLAWLDSAAPPARLPVADTDTDLAAALQAALRLAEPGRDTRIALLSDGRPTRGDPEEALSLARAGGIPVYFLDASSPRDGDSWIEDVRVPARLRAGQRLPVSLVLASQTHRQGRLVLRLEGTPVAERMVELTPDRSVTVGMELPPPEGRDVTLEALLEVDGDPEPRNNRQARLVNVPGRGRILYISRSAQEAPLATSLYRGGWPLESLPPAALSRRLADGDAGVVVLDDIAIADLPAETWRQLIHQVIHEGTGLLVLGGPHAFAAGGYRHSALEGILPVTAETRAPQPPAAVLFLLDTSGSMDRHDGGPSRLAVARQAMLDTARRLQPGDLTGLLEFAAEPRLVLPLAERADPVSDLGAERGAPPAGGTRLGPALDRAIGLLATAPPEQRLLVLVTDGHLDDPDFASLAPRIEAAGIDVIALAIGADAETGALERLSALNGGRLFRVDRVAELPALMRAELDRRRPLLESGHFVPEPEQPLPFLAAARDWPVLERYWVTRAREDARVYLRVQGDPLLASRFAGAGRVATFTARLGDWRDFWRNWPHAAAFAGGLPDWLDARRGGADLDLSVETTEGRSRLRLETSPANPQPVQLWIEGPDGRPRELAPEAVAPGRYEAEVPAILAGRYRAVARVGEHQLQHAWLHREEREFLPDPDAARRLERWRSRGLLRDWPDALRGQPAADADGGLRVPLLALVLIGYLLLLTAERRGDLLSRVRHALPLPRRVRGSTSPSGDPKLGSHEP